MEYLKSSSIRVPGGGDKVFKDECIYCFDSPVRKVYVREFLTYAENMKFFASHWQLTIFSLLERQTGE